MLASIHNTIDYIEHVFVCTYLLKVVGNDTRCKWSAHSLTRKQKRQTPIYLDASARIWGFLTGISV